MFPKLFQILYGLLFFIVPLIMAPFTSELFEFNKIIAIYVLTTLIGSLWLLEMIFKDKFIFKRTVLDIPILLFLVSQVSSSFFSIDPHTSLFGYYGRFNGGLFSIISYLILFYGYVTHFNLKDTIRFLKISLTVSFIVILWGLPGKFGYDLSCLLFTGKLNNACWTSQFRPAERMFSTLGQPNWLGAYLAINFSFGLFFLFSLKNKIQSQSRFLLNFFSKYREYLYLIYLTLNFVSILFTRSRSSLLAAGVVFFVYLIYLCTKPNFLHLQFRTLGILLIAMSLSVLIIGTGIDKIDITLRYPLRIIQNSIKQKSAIKNQDKLSTPSIDTSITESFDIRKIVWLGALELTRRYPLFGTGVETFAYSYYFVRPKIHNLTSEWDYLYNKAHNEYLNYSATTGLLGIFTYLIMIFGFLFTVFRRIILNLREKTGKADLYIAIILAYLSILICNFFGFSTTTINIFLYILPAMVFVDEIKSEQTVSFKLSLRKLFMITVVSFAALTFLIYEAKYYLADYYYAKSEEASLAEEYQYSALYLDTALKLRSEHVYEDKYSYTLAQLALIAAYDNKNGKIAKALLKLSEEYSDRSLKRAPRNLLYWKTRAKNAYLYYQMDFDKSYIKEALKSLDTASLIAPTDPKIPYSVSLFYTLLEDDAKDPNEKEKYRQLSLKAIDSAIDLKSNYRDAYLLKAQLLKKYGDKQQARSVLQYIIKHIEPNDLEAKKALQEL